MFKSYFHALVDKINKSIWLVENSLFERDNVTWFDVIGASFCFKIEFTFCLVNCQCQSRNTFLHVIIKNTVWQRVENSLFNSWNYFILAIALFNLFKKSPFFRISCIHKYYSLNSISLFIGQSNVKVVISDDHTLLELRWSASPFDRSSKVSKPFTSC